MALLNAPTLQRSMDFTSTEGGTSPPPLPFPRTSTNSNSPNLPRTTPAAAMDSLAPLLRAFYTGALSAEERTSIHARLLQTLREPACITAAADYITQLTTTADLEPDPFVLHYALHALEVCARTAFASTPGETRSRLLQLLIDFLVSAHARNTSTTANVASIPAHALNKAAVAAVQLGLREWVRNSTHAFPHVVLALIDQNGHSAESLPRILAGIALVTGLIDAAVDATRKDLPSADRATLLQQLKGIADGIVAALEIGMRISGPHFPKSVAVSAVRAVGSLVRVEPACAAESVTVLKRCVQGRSDRMGAEILGVLAELYGEGKVKMPVEWEPTLAHASGLLEAVAMGETALGDDEDVCLYRTRLVGYGEAVSRRVIALGAPVDVLQRLLNGLMGISLRWADDCPDQFVVALDAWLGILEALEDAEVESNELLERVYGAVSDLCVKRCMRFTNGKVLGLLEEPVDNDFSWSKQNGHHNMWRTRTIFRWDEEAAVMAEVASDPVTMSTVLFASTDETGEDTDGGDQGDILSACSRTAYIRKCVETMVACASMSPERVGGAVSEFICNALRMKGQAFVIAEEVMKADVEDLCTAAQIAYCVIPLFPAKSPQLQLLFQITPELMKSAIEKREAKLAVLLLRTTASLTQTLAIASPDFVQRIGSSLIPVTRRVLSSANCPDRLACAAVLLLLSLDRFCRRVLFQSEPPIDASMIAETSYRTVSALGLAAMTRWALVPERDPNTSLPIKWTNEEWARRQSGFQQLCSNVFKEFQNAILALETTNPNNWNTMLAIARGAGLLKTMVLSMRSVHGKATDAFWIAAGKQTTHDCMNALVGLRAQVSNAQSGLDADARRISCGVMGCLVGAIESVLRICSRQISAEAPDLAGKTIDTVLDFATAQSSVRLAHAALRLIREQLANSSGLSPGPGIQLAARTLEQGGEQDVCVAAVNVLVEALKQHWRDFWPGDVVGNGTSSPASVAADESVRRLYMTALHGLLKGLRSPDLATCRAALLGLQSLDAARRLYSRSAAFRENGAGDAVVWECLRIMGAGGEASRESLSDEAVQVVWGIAKIDMGGFYSRVLPGVIRELGGVSDEQGRALVDAYAFVKERPGFVRKVTSFANDFVYLRALNSGPSL